MPRFTIRDLLLATTLVAVGVGLIVFPLHFHQLVDEEWSLPLFFFGGGAFIGAGIFTPFKRPWTGVIVAVVLQILFALVVFIAIVRR
jgi:hypothetical protein